MRHHPLLRLYTGKEGILREDEKRSVDRSQGRAMKANISNQREQKREMLYYLAAGTVTPPEREEGDKTKKRGPKEKTRRGKNIMKCCRKIGKGERDCD